MLDFQLHGPLAITDSNGSDCRPKLLKSRAILAVLALTPGHRHSRSWFQNLLWEDRQHAQGRSSLRAALSDIRRHLGPFADTLATGPAEVALNLEGFALRGRTEADGLLLEGFDVPHAPNFEEWLRLARARDEAAPPAPARPVAAAPDRQARPPVVFLAHRPPAIATMLGLQVDTLVDGIAKSLDDAGIARALDGRTRPGDIHAQMAAAEAEGCDYVLHAESSETSAGAIARMKLVRISDHALLWSKSAMGASTLDLTGPAAAQFVVEVVDVLADLCLKRNELERRVRSPDLLANLAVARIFSLGAPRFAEADRMLRTAHEADPKGRYLAWRAYLRTIKLGELQFEDREGMIEEGISLARRALEGERHNSVVLALCAQAEIMLTSRYGVARDFAAQAVDLNRYNAMAWSLLGAASAFDGDVARGYAQAQVGARLARGARYSFKLESYASSTGILAGDFAGARRHAERAQAKAPDFAPPLRYLSALYCQSGQWDLAHAAARALRAREPGFSFDRLSDEDYPSESIRKAGLLRHLPAREV